MMRVVEVREPGAPDVLVIGQRPIPTPGLGQVLIKVHAAGVNRPDVVQRTGKYPPPPGASDLLGLEVSGTVFAVGEGVEWPVVGTQVCALTPGGGYAEYSLTDARHCLPIPDGCSLLEAAALPETCFTVWSNIFLRASLASTETLLVHGGTSGIGSTAIQIASALGVQVFTTAGNDEKCRACEALGAYRAINYRTGDFVEVIRKETEGRGVDVILDIVGGSYFERSLKCLREDGRYISIAAMEGAKVSLNLNVVARYRFTISGSTLRAQSDETKASIAADVRANVWPLVEAGHFRPVVHSVFPLDRAEDAHDLMESSRHIGKIILQIGD